MSVSTNSNDLERIEKMMREMVDKLQVVNTGVFRAEDFDPNAINELVELHNMVMAKSRFSTMEMEAIVEELATLRKS